MLSDLTLFQTIFFVIAASSTIILIIQTILAVVGFGHNDSDIGGDHDGGGDIHADVPHDIAHDVHFDHSHDGGGHVPHDTDNTGPNSAASHYDANGLQLFTIRGIMAFLMVGSWVGFLTARTGTNEFIALLLAIVSGAIALFFMAKLLQFLMGMQEDGTTNVKNALGQVGQVYIRIPAEEKGVGKVNVTVQEKLCEFDAVTEKDEILQTGEMVYVTDIRAGNVLVVEKAEEK
ncbi:MAG: hypothetical protein FWD71_06230 [Oscillospiraceae bacterium]|nr:hypothetical protein [Oscillospiraceae bacterium]